jgi:hypothetical protein
MTYINADLQSRTWNDYQSVVKVGQIPVDSIRKFYSPLRFAQDLQQQLINHVYDPMCQVNQGTHWSSTLNCQTFTRSAIEYLGCKLPSNVTIVSDCIPTLVDVYIIIITSHRLIARWGQPCIYGIRFFHACRS